VVEVYELAPAEYLLLGQAAAVVDLLARADDELKRDDLTTVGSVGQVKSHPLIGSTVELRRLLDVLIRGMALPYPGEDQGKRRSPVAQAAAAARWGRHDGSVA
jgi:hypothetical protein